MDELNQWTRLVLESEAHVGDKKQNLVSCRMLSLDTSVEFDTFGSKKKQGVDERSEACTPPPSLGTEMSVVQQYR